jgi:hypothetical protein
MSELSSYDFYVDKKMTVWHREYVSFQASSEEEAKKKVLAYIDGEFQRDIYHGDCEFLYDTAEELPAEENDGFSTIEVYEDKKPYDLIYANGKA